MPRAKRRRVQEEWQKFRNALLAVDAPHGQVIDMRRAFYGGVSIFYRIITDLDPSNEPAQADLDMLSDIQSELDEFLKATKERREGY